MWPIKVCIFSIYVLMGLAYAAQDKNAERLEEFLILKDNVENFKVSLSTKEKTLASFELQGAHSGDGYKYTYANIQDEVQGLKEAIREGELRLKLLEGELSKTLRELLTPFRKLRATEDKLAKAKKELKQSNKRFNLKLKRKIKLLEFERAKERHDLFYTIAKMDSTRTNLNIIKNLNGELYNYLNADYCEKGTSLSDLDETTAKTPELQGFLLASLNEQDGVLPLIKSKDGTWEGTFTSEGDAYKPYKIHLSNLLQSEGDSFKVKIEITDWSGGKSEQSGTINKGPSGYMINSFGAYSLTATHLN